MKTCTFVTGNPNKVIEVTAILGDTIPIRTLALDLPEIQGSLEEIARDKCRRATQIVLLPPSPPPPPPPRLIQAETFLILSGPVEHSRTLTEMNCSFLFLKNRWMDP